MKHFIIIGPDTTTEFDIADNHILAFSGREQKAEDVMAGNGGEGIFNRQSYPKPAVGHPIDERYMIEVEMTKLFEEKLSVKEMIGPNNWKIKFEMSMMDKKDMKKLIDAGYEITGIGSLTGKYGYDLEVYVTRKNHG